MRIIWDCRILSMYPMGKPGFRGGTETMIEQITSRLANKGHQVHVITRDLDYEEQRGPNLWYWGPKNHPTQADVVVQTQQVIPQSLSTYDAPIFILAHTGCDPELGPNNQWAQAIDAWPVFSNEHGRMLLEARPAIPPDRVFVTGLGIELGDYPLACKQRHCADREGPMNCKGCLELVGELASHKVPGRMLYANDPMRGLFYVLDIFDLVKKEVPEASLHIAYDPERQFAVHEWDHNYKGQLSWEMRKRIAETPGVVSLGALSREDLIREQLECSVHVMPSDPPNVGTQTWGITQMECAAAGAALVLSDVEAFPECFGEAATILPVIGYFSPEHGRRVDASDYAAVVVELMKDGEKWAEASRKARALAEKNDWSACADRWYAMLAKLEEGIKVA